MSKSRKSSIDPDVDLHDARQTAESKHHPWRISLVIACGGALGAYGRWLIGSHWTVPATGLPLTTLFINTAGCFFIGVLMVLIEQSLTGRQYLRPFLGVGVLGGFTTFSTYSVETVQRLTDAPGIGILYFFVTPLAALLGVILGVLAAMVSLRLVYKVHKGGIA